jgi:hypothetical protein
MEEAIRSAIGDLKPGEVITAEQLAHRLGLDQKTVGIWLDVLAGEGRLISEHRVLSEIRSDESHVVLYRVPPYG